MGQEKKREEVNMKERVIAEYLAGDTTYRKLEGKYGIGRATICRWVEAVEGRSRVRKKSVPVRLRLSDEVEGVPEDVRQLEVELRKSRLENKLLKAMIEIAEEQLGIEIRKKSGARR